MLRLIPLRDLARRLFSIGLFGIRAGTMGAYKYVEELWKRKQVPYRRPSRPDA